MSSRHRILSVARSLACIDVSIHKRCSAVSTAVMYCCKSLVKLSMQSHACRVFCPARDLDLCLIFSTITIPGCFRGHMVYVRSCLANFFNLLKLLYGKEQGTYSAGGDKENHATAFGFSVITALNRLSDGWKLPHNRILPQHGRRTNKLLRFWQQISSETCLCVIFT